MQSNIAFIRAGALSLLLSGCIHGTVNEANGDNAPLGEEEPIGEAEQPFSYLCRIDAQNQWHTCNAGPIQMASTGNGRYRAKVDFGLSNIPIAPSSERRLDIFALLCNPSGWSLHLSDSPSGVGKGDRGTADHDAQTYVFNHDFILNSSSHAQASEIDRVADAVGPACETLHFTVYHYIYPMNPWSRFAAMGNEPWHGAEYHADLFNINYGPCPSGNDPQRGLQCDWEDRLLLERSFIYIGFNQSVAAAAPGFNPLGSGLVRACLVLNDADHEPQNCLDPWPLPQ